MFSNYLFFEMFFYIINTIIYYLEYFNFIMKLSFFILFEFILLIRLISLYMINK